MEIKEIRNIKNIEIKKAIIHYIDPPRKDKKNSEGFVSSEALLPLEDNSKLSNFIENHIINSISHKSSKIAKFKNINPNQVSGVCSNIINETIDFIKGSIFLGEKLFEVLLDNRTKETNLLVVLFSGSVS